MPYLFLHLTFITASIFLTSAVMEIRLENNVTGDFHPGQLCKL